MRGTPFDARTASLWLELAEQLQQDGVGDLLVIIPGRDKELQVETVQLPGDLGGLSCPQSLPLFLLGSVQKPGLPGHL